MQATSLLHVFISLLFASTIVAITANRCEDENKYVRCGYFSSFKVKRFIMHYRDSKNRCRERCVTSPQQYTPPVWFCGKCPKKCFLCWIYNKQRSD